MNNIKETLKQRGKVYGDFDKGMKAIVTIIQVLNELHICKTGTNLSKRDEYNLYMIVMKLVRLGASPRHVDSWHDIAGYSTLIEDTIQPVDKGENTVNYEASYEDTPEYRVKRYKRVKK